MITIDVREIGENLTLEDCAYLYDKVQSLSPSKGIEVRPDELVVNEWQSKHLFSSPLGGKMKFWRGIPIKVWGGLGG